MKKIGSRTDIFTAFIVEKGKKRQTWLMGKFNFAKEYLNDKFIQLICLWKKIRMFKTSSLFKISFVFDWTEKRLSTILFVSKEQEMIALKIKNFWSELKSWRQAKQRLQTFFLLLPNTLPPDELSIRGKTSCFIFFSFSLVFQTFNWYNQKCFEFRVRNWERMKNFFYCKHVLNFILFLT